MACLVHVGLLIFYQLTVRVYHNHATEVADPPSSVFQVQELLVLLFLIQRVTRLHQPQIHEATFPEIRPTLAKSQVAFGSFRDL